MKRINGMKLSMSSMIVVALAAMLMATSGCYDPPTAPPGTPPVPSGSSPASRAYLTSPACGDRLAPTTTFEWTAGTDVDFYTLEFYKESDGVELLKTYPSIRGTSQVVHVTQIPRQSVIWAKLTTHHLGGGVSEPQWCQFWYPEEERGWVLQEFKYRAVRKWGHGTSGEEVLDSNPSVPASCREFNHRWSVPLDNGGHYTLEATMELVQLPAFVEEGGSGPLEVIVSGIIDTQGLGISRTAQVGVIADGTPRAVYRQNAENQRVEMQTSVGPRGVAPNRSTGEIKFIASSGLNDLNDSTLYLEVTAVYRRT